MGLDFWGVGGGGGREAVDRFWGLKPDYSRTHHTQGNFPARARARPHHHTHRATRFW
jgi:hypothetical protein